MASKKRPFDYFPKRNAKSKIIKFLAGYSFISYFCVSLTEHTYLYIARFTINLDVRVSLRLERPYQWR